MSATLRRRNRRRRLLVTVSAIAVLSASTALADTLEADLDGPMATAGADARLPGSQDGLPDPALTPIATDPVYQSVPTPPPGPAIPPVVPPATRLNPTGRDVTLSGPLSSGGVILGEIGFVLGADDSIRIDGPTLLLLAKQILAPAKYDELAAAVGKSGDVRAAQIRSLGYDIVYDPETISLSLVVPQGARAVESLDLAERDQAQLGAFDQPAKFSAFMTAQAALNYEWSGDSHGIEDPIVLMNGAARYGPFVLESEQSIEGGTADVFQRQGTRLVYDDLQHTARWTFGDLLPSARGFSGTTPMSGISIYRSYEVLDPQRNVQPLGNETFTVASPSTVQAYVNGLLVRQVRLNPGVYNIHDFPFAQGSNNVSLVITDDAGNRQTLHFSLFFDRTLLAPGLTEFGFYAGVMSPFSGSGPQYHFNMPVASGYFRRGITDTLTVGANFQAQKTGFVAGVEDTWASRWGTWNLNAAGSDNKTIGAGFALNVGYSQTFNPKSAFSTSVAFSGQYESTNFSTPNSLLATTTPGTPALNNTNAPYAFQTEASISQGLWRNQYVNLDAQWSQGRAGNPNQTSVRLDYGLALSRRIDLVVGVEYQDNTTARGFGGLLTLIFRPNQRTVVQGDVDTLQNTEDLDVSVSSQQTGTGSWSVDGQVVHQDGVYGVNANGTYLANRFELGFAQESDINSAAGDPREEISSVNLGTALVFADGKFALSRPVYDSFAMVEPHSTLNGASVYVDRTGSDYIARSDWLGPAVDPDLTSYSERTESVDVPRAPAGYDLGAGSIRMYPPYHSGYLITVGSDYSVTAIGRLLDRDGNPVSLLAGKAIEEAAPNRPPVVLFTNRAGMFGATGLRPGKWRIVMPTEPESVYQITIPAKATGVVRLGDERPEH